MKTYALVIDQESCWGCKTCEIACKQEMDVIDGVKLISVSDDGFRWRDAQLDFLFQVNVCRHCDDPPCLEACPEEAILKREDGIVVMDYEKCTGCRSCIEACPYEAIAFDTENSVAQKCNLCHHRVDKGLIPACADNVCLAHCIYFGDPTEIDEIIAEKRRQYREARM
jgi:Fe-S-cluster-containing dehydrogenase component